MKTITASDANRHFSNLLRKVATGEVITVLSRGKPVATIAPARSTSGEREAAKLRGLVVRIYGLETARLARGFADEALRDFAIPCPPRRHLLNCVPRARPRGACSRTTTSRISFGLCGLGSPSGQAADYFGSFTRSF